MTKYEEGWVDVTWSPDSDPEVMEYKIRLHWYNQPHFPATQTHPEIHPEFDFDDVRVSGCVAWCDGDKKHPVALTLDENARQAVESYILDQLYCKGDLWHQYCDVVAMRIGG